jgi:hypothetical protein
MVTENISHFETCYFNFLQPLSVTNKNIVTRFPINVNPIGIGAHWSSNYNSLSKKIIYFIKGVLRVVYPSLKI